MSPQPQPSQTDTFRCDRQDVTLTVGGCARMWRSTQEKRPAAWESRSRCIGCPIGAAHAGEGQEVAAKARAVEALRRFCPGCQRPASRLIRGQHCISCYNRRREVACGKNAKGNPPVQVRAKLHTVRLAVGRPWPSNRPVEVETHRDVMSRTEAMVLSAKRASGPVHFGRPPFLTPEKAAA